ncbi:putative Na+-dependent transporter [Xenococcus sp. PCC 7305]|uniref:bile acid:sodium symporter n=1 Tax=Xenococcus sp. PCC 7305 TaxID=102125 RepID=UPI0002AC46BE|nr:bile acid:sodium symporter [Xenococcus sp. PCC 7305]ELS04227.1 putative Na+-dependent transporter [Xenococcus sp. PCC 7305]
MDNPLISSLVTITIFTLMLAIGVNLSSAKLLALWRRPAILLRALLAVVVLVPLIVIVLLHLFDLPPGVASGLALLAAAPGAPLTTKRSQMAGGNFPYSVTLQLTLALLAVLIIPFTLGIFYSLFDLEIESVTISQVFHQVARVQFFPVILGLLIQKLSPKITSAIAKPIIMIANSLFLLLIILLIIPSFRLMVQIGAFPLVAIVLMVIFSLAIGHIFGEAEVGKRSALAIACVARNVGLAIYIAYLSNAQEMVKVVPTLISYVILGALIAIPYSQWSKRQLT